MTKKSMLLLAAAGIAIAAPAWAESPFDGTWKADVKSTQLEEKPSVYELKNGLYSCKTCVPTAVSVKADGEFHPVAGQAYYDAMAVKVADDRTVKTMRRKGGKPVGESVTELSPDGKTVTFSWNNINPDGSNVSGKGWQKRLSDAPAGAHGISGSWITTGYDNVSDNGVTVMLRVDGDMLHLETPAGESYAAKFGGPEAALEGDDSGTKVRVRWVNASMIEEVNLRDGKVVGVTTMAVEPDGKTMNAVYENTLRGTKMRYKAHKQ